VLSRASPGFRLPLFFAAAALCAFGQNWTALDRQAEAAYGKGDLKEAIRVARLAVAAASDAKQIGRSLDRLGFFQYTAGELQDGEASLRRALDLRRDRVGAETEDYAESANDLALLLRDAGRAAEARPLAEEAVAIRRRLLGPRQIPVAESLNTLGSTLGKLGDYDAAIREFEEALAIHESQPGPRDFSEEYGTLCINLAGTYQRVGKYVKAEDTFRKGLAVLRVKPGVHHPAYAASVAAYAYLQADLGHYREALSLYDEAGKLLPEQLGERHPVFAAFLNNRGSLYATLGKFTAAEADYRKSLELKRAIFPADAFTIGATLRNLARLVSAGQPEEGERLFQEAVDLYSRSAAPPPFDLASALLGLEETQRRRGERAAARASLERVFDVAAKGLPPRHPLYAAAVRDLALIHLAGREYAAAEQKLHEAIEIITESQGPDHPDLARYTALLARVYDQAGDYAAAEALYRRSLEISGRVIADMLTVGSETDRAAVLASLEDPIPPLVSIQRRAGDRVPSLRVLAFEAVARRKGILLDAAHEWDQSLRASPDPNVQALARRRQAILECEASLTLALGYRDWKPAVLGSCSLPGSEWEGRYERLLHELRGNWTPALGRQALDAVKLLRGRVDAVETSLSRAVPQFASARRPVRLSTLRAGLRPDETLMEFVAADGRYGVFLLRRSGSLQWIDLGAAAPIDRAAQDLIAAANDWSAALRNGESRGAETSEKTARDALGVLSARLRPAIRSLTRNSGHRRVRIAADGMLSLMPFAALTDDQGRFLVENFTISYVAAARDLVTPDVAPSGLPGPVVVAVSAGPVPPNASGADRLAQLPLAQREARQVQTWFPHALLWDNGVATEQRVKALHSPALLHIVGHGIVRGNEDCRLEPQNPACGLTGLDPTARVMGLSAIVLEEAYGRGGGSQDDGMLTALELQGVDLRGTEMLVLSQCRMADGIPSVAGGVYGMRLAAAIAGARSFVAPLWNVSDTAEQSLMDGFYHDLAGGADRAEALRNAQVRLLRNPRTASALYWAAVILSGAAGPLRKGLFSGK
jgi:CHAT domain-containing protein/tetratricopeptide (TPR) repeat protein